VHLADSRKEYFLFNWINLNAERARYPCSLFAEIRSKRGKGDGDKLCKLVILVEATLSCFFLSLSHAREVGRLESCNKKVLRVRVLLVRNHHVPGSSHVVGEVAIAARGGLCDMQPPQPKMSSLSGVYLKFLYVCTEYKPRRGDLPSRIQPHLVCWASHIV